MDFEEFERCTKDDNFMEREDLLRALTSPVEDVRRLAASHCIGPENQDLQEWILKEGSFHARYGLGEAAYVSLESQHELLKHTQCHTALAENRAVASEVLDLLVETTVMMAAQDICRHPNLSTRARIRLVERLPGDAAFGFGSKEDLEPEVLLAMAWSEDTLVRSVAGKHRNLVWSADLPAFFVLQYAPEETIARLAPDTSLEEIESLARGWNGSLKSLAEAIALTGR